MYEFHSPLTYVTTYYNEPDRLEFLLDNFLIDFFSEIIIVDDGSQEFPAEPVVLKYVDRLPITLLRVKKDLGFNSHGCRNLAMSRVRTEWALLADIDIHFDAGACADLQKAVESSTLKQYFTFWRGHKQDYIGRCFEGINDFCIRVEDFMESCGYDEEYTGIHYGDKMFIEKLNSFMVRTVLPNVIIDNRHARKTKMTKEVSITTYDNENNLLLHPLITDEQMKTLNDFVGQRNENRELWDTKSFADFEWEQVFPPTYEDRREEIIG